MELKFQSPLPREGERQDKDTDEGTPAEISIPAPREGSDSKGQAQPRQRIKFPIPAPREGERPGGGKELEVTSYFNPRSPRGERRIWISHLWMPKNFNPRSPRRGATTTCSKLCICIPYFNPPLPARGATPSMIIYSASRWISIPAPREGSDARLLLRRGGGEDILQSPLPARGATEINFIPMDAQVFQSPLPARGATVQYHGPRR